MSRLCICRLHICPASCHRGHFPFSTMASPTLRVEKQIPPYRAVLWSQKLEEQLHSRVQQQHFQQRRWHFSARTCNNSRILQQQEPSSPHCENSRTNCPYPTIATPIAPSKPSVLGTPALRNATAALGLTRRNKRTVAGLCLKSNYNPKKLMHC